MGLFSNYPPSFLQKVVGRGELLGVIDLIGADADENIVLTVGRYGVNLIILEGEPDERDSDL